MPLPVVVKRSGVPDAKGNLVARILGPSADALGEAWGRWTEARLRNVGQVVDAAERKLGSQIDEDGQVPLRVAAAILEAGSYCDDRVMGEYLGGALASARTKVGRDDRGARWLQVITSMSSYDIRLHYVLYAAQRKAHLRRGARTRWADASEYRDISSTMFVGWDELKAAMDFAATEHGWHLVTDAGFALSRSGFLEHFKTAGRDFFEDVYKREMPFPTGVMVFRPSPVGVQLFMWAHGLGDAWDRFDDPGFELPSIDTDVPASLAIEVPGALAFPELRITESEDKPRDQ
jgi:hypothetical protein